MGSFRQIASGASVGRGDRRDLRELDPRDPAHARAIAVAPAVAFLVRAHHAAFAADGSITAATIAAPAHGRFPTHPRIQSAAPLTGFLVTRQHLLTAAHGLPGEAGELMALFDFTPDRLAPPDIDGVRRYRFEPGRWARVARVVAANRGPESGDYAILELDRAPPGRSPTSCAVGRGVEPDAPVAMIGHPFGQPVQITIGDPRTPSTHARALAADGGRLASTLAASRGHSGSPVLALDRDGVIAVHDQGYAGDIGERSAVRPATHPRAFATLLATLTADLRSIGAALV
jgi:hypothetical protein